MASSKQCECSTPPLTLPSSLEPNPEIGDAAPVFECSPAAVNERAVYPPPSDGEPTTQTRWFEERFFKRIAVQEFLPLASAARGDGHHSCRFGPRQGGTYNVVLLIIFDDGVEWFAKMPRVPPVGDANHDYLMSEYATLKFLQETLPKIPTPQVHGRCFNCNNPTKTPYFFMDKIPGLSFSNSIAAGTLNKTGVYETLRQLASLKKYMMEHSFQEIGSLTVLENTKERYVVERQLTSWNFFDYIPGEKHWTGPFCTSIEYYARLLQISWTESQLRHPEPEAALEQWKLHSYLSSILPSFVGKETGRFYLAHTDLNGANIMVDDKGNITGIIDWEFASTLPARAAEHYPEFLSDEERFVYLFEDFYSDPRAELRGWREFYAKQFQGDFAMEEYLENISATIAFEEILRDRDFVTVDHLVEKFKFLESASTVDDVGLPFPWKEPTKSPLNVVNHDQNKEMAVQTQSEKLQNTLMNRFSSESLSLNDVVYQSHETPKPVRDVFNRIKKALSAVWSVCMCRKREDMPNFEMS
jgi:hypothetical protein